MHLAPFETRYFPFETFGLQGLSGMIHVTASFEGHPGDLVLATGSTDQSGTYVFEVEPQGIGRSFSKEGHYWNGFDTMFTLWNPTDQAQDFLVTFFYGEEERQYKLPVSLGPMASSAIDVSKVIAAQQPDEDGNLIPLGTREGSVVFSNAQGMTEWMTLAASIGIVNVQTATCGAECTNCCGYTGFRVTPNPGYCEVGFTAQCGAEATYCNGQVYFFTGSRPLVTKGISFGVLSRQADGTWNTSAVEGIPAVSLVSAGASQPPSLVIRPFHQAGRVVSLREFSNNAFNHHHGIQSTERFGRNTDPDGDGFVNEITRADITAVTIFQATMAVPGRVIPNDPAIEAAVLLGEQRFQSIGCARCHVPSLPLDDQGWIFTEPNPDNPPGNLRVNEAPTLSVDLTEDNLPSPRLKPDPSGVVHVPAFTDLKLHDICDGPDDPNREPLDMNQPPGSMGFFAGNRKFITRKLWGAANEPAYFHHGQFTTMREAILAHGGEARLVRASFQALNPYDQDCIIEFLKTLQVFAARHQRSSCGRKRQRKEVAASPPPNCALSQATSKVSGKVS